MSKVNRREFLDFLTTFSLAGIVGLPVGAAEALPEPELKTFWTAQRDSSKSDPSWVWYQLNIGWTPEPDGNRPYMSLFNPGFDRHRWTARFSDLNFDFYADDAEEAQSVAQQKLLEWLQRLVRTLS